MSARLKRNNPLIFKTMTTTKSETSVQSLYSHCRNLEHKNLLKECTQLKIKFNIFQSNDFEIIKSSMATKQHGFFFFLFYLFFCWKKFISILTLDEETRRERKRERKVVAKASERRN